MSEKTTMQEIEGLLEEMLVQPAARLQRRRRGSNRRVRVARVDGMLPDLIAQLEQRLAAGAGGAHE
ncbi:hypothetical protein Q3O98_03860 [Ralstonia pseudosolanacearum]|uniref:hypothetical protein n=1 Tax=Ralstonia pseudosolanacearum TaxID=1310165 RepID=UPI002675654A|nr:hypothetical protein [Ralstonia pseudosolanacearum]MDO3620228.1 hypothetical protein [Ralstonia pseudosolanacearum]